MIAWIITKDHLAKGDGVHDRTGKFALRGSDGWISEEAKLDVKRRTESEGESFKLYDDDGELYYEGRFLDVDSEDEPESWFAPLDWAMNDSGCTRIDYLNAKTGEWETL